MKKLMTTIFCLFLSTLFIQGCTKQQQAATSQDAIQQSQTLKTTDEQAKYLIAQANSLINSKQFNDAIAIAQHILQNLDANSQDANSIIEQAKAGLQKMAQEKVAEAKSDITNKINSLGNK